MVREGPKRRRDQKKRKAAAQKAGSKQSFSIDWIPQKRQLRFLKACGLDYAFPVYMEKNEDEKPKLVKRDDKPDTPTRPEADVIGYGGAAGGGKSDALLMALFIGCLTFPGANGAYFRRTFRQLEGAGGAIMRSKELFDGFPGAKWHGTKRRWTFESLNNSVIVFNHLQKQDDVYDYQSQQFDFICFDEATQFTKFQYMYLATRNRATVQGVKPFMALATNPGGVGHQWFKQQFVDVGVPEEPHDVEVNPGVFRKHIFIPAKLSDNIILEDRDPHYRKNLEAQSEIERKRLLEGDWNIHEGQYFPEYSEEVHELEPFEIPDYWKRFISIDYGLDMSAVLWYALDNHGFYYCYKELMKPNLSLSDLALEIQKKTGPIERELLAYTVASPDLWNRRQETGKPGVQILRENGMSDFGLRPADNRRVEGWRVVREYLKPIEDPLSDEPEETPLVARMRFLKGPVQKLCSDIPLLQHDDKNPDDVADQPHDITHAPESLRYFCMSRPPLCSETKEEREIRKKTFEKKTKPRSKITGY